jgi:hypothetical protein
MALLKINGADMPSPSEMSVGIQDIHKDPQRNANGRIIMERIATKAKIELSWNYLTPSQLSQLLTAVSALFFEVTYTNPVTNTERTATFYKGDVTAPIMDYINGNLRWKDIKFNVIEQ